MTERLLSDVCCIDVRWYEFSTDTKSYCFVFCREFGDDD